MKWLVGALLAVLALLACSAKESYQPRQGDIVFQSLPNPLGMDLVDTIEGATGSPFSHCGMVLLEKGSWQVIEAIGPVQVTPLSQWQERGRGGKMWVYRLGDEHLAHVPKALAAMKKDLGKPYDPRYRFDAEAIYCSELLYRGWKSATGKPLGRTVKLQDLNWQPYRKVIVAIEGSETIPLTREIITPRDLAKAPELTPIWPAVADSKKKK